MTAKDTIKADLEKLVKDGNALVKKFGDEKEPPVHLDYQAWYSKALRVVELLARDRYAEFRGFYEPDPKRKTLGYGTYVIQDFLKGVKPGAYELQNFNCREQATFGVYNQLTILVSIGARANSVLGDIQGMLYAELQDEEIETATTLLKINARAAGALAGVILEAHLQKVAEARGAKIAKRHPTIADLNDPLKAAGIYDITVWRKISYLADIRNLCSHKKAADPSSDQVKELIEGVQWAVKNIA